MNPKSTGCVPKRSNFMSKAAMSVHGPFLNGIPGMNGHAAITFYRTVHPRFWEKSYRANASRKRRAGNKVKSD